MSNQNKLKERRKYQRVQVEPSYKTLKANVKLYGETHMYDMSYSGAAFAQPQHKKISRMDETLVLEFNTESEQARVKAKPVRITNDVVAVHFEDISVAARMVIDRLVTDRIIGLNMRMIDPKHYISHSDFTFWFHGPKETNLYLWTDNDQLLKAQFDTAEAMLIFDGESFTFENRAVDLSRNLNNQQIALKVHSILQQIPNPNPSLLRFKKLLSEHING